MKNRNVPTRRQFLQQTTTGVGIAAIGSALPAFADHLLVRSILDTLPVTALAYPPTAYQSEKQTGDHGANLLTDERFRVGAQFRMKQFIQKGADPQDAEAIFRSLPN